jgi:hypothetical protein
MYRPGGLVLVLAMLGCGPRVAIDGSGSSDGSSDGDTTGVTPSTTTPSTTAPTTSTDSTSTGTSTTTSAEVTSSVDEDTGVVSSGSFVCHHCSPDGGQVTIECDIWTQDCPRGEKCMPWSNDGGSTWNATRCSPLDPTPDEIGESCVVEGSGVSGIDSCATSSMCFGVDPETNMGTCAALCTGDVIDPVCPDELTCVVVYDSVLPICLRACDPFAPDCGADTCTIDEATGLAWCIPAVLVGETVYADDCDAPFRCDSDFLCVGAPHVPSCNGETCCTMRCDPSMPTPCPDEAAGQVCIPLDADPTIGYCGIPR